MALRDPSTGFRASRRLLGNYDGDERCGMRAAVTGPCSVWSGNRKADRGRFLRMICFAGVLRYSVEWGGGVKRGLSKKLEPSHKCFDRGLCRPQGLKPLRKAAIRRG